jgi:hypothetical protein
MALPEMRFGNDSPLTPEDLTPEVMLAFERHCLKTEGTLLQDLYREPTRIVGEPAPVITNDEMDVFWSAFK